MCAIAIRKVAAWSAFVAVASGAVLGGAARAESIEITGWYAAPEREIALLGSIAVDRFAGEDGAALALAIERRLGSIRDRRGGPYFDLLAADGGEAEGIVSGAVTTGLDTTRYKQTEKRCPEDKRSCTKEEKIEIEIGCTRRVITLDADVRVVRTSDGRVIYSGTEPRRDEASWCAGAARPAEPEGVIRTMLASVADSFAARAVPSETRQRVRFREDTKPLAKPDIARFKLALRQTKTDMAAACATWAELDAAVPNHPAVVFNLALCAEAAGDLERAEAIHAKLGGAPARDGLARIRSQRAAIDDEAERARRAGER